MPFDTPPPRALLLPGSGSDEVFVTRALAPALAALGVVCVAVRPDPTAVLASCRRALDAAADEPGPLLVGGVSLGAAVAATWALENPARVSGVLLALPAWLGGPAGAPAALSAAATATDLRRRGLDAVLDTVGASTQSWLSAELRRAWTRQWPHLPDALEEAATSHAPTAAGLRGLPCPVGVAASVDDALHPLAVAEQVVAAAPRARLVTLTLDELGADPGALGRAVVRAWREAGGQLPG